MKVKKEIRLFYSTSLTEGVSEFELSAEESHHVTKVMRCQQDDLIHVTNGFGTLIEGVIFRLHKKSTLIKVVKLLAQNPPESELTIAISPTKNMDRFEWFLEKATEIGVKRVIPMLTDNSERKVIKKERLIKKMISAMKQSGRLWLPELSEITPFEEILSLGIKSKYIAHCHNIDKQHLKKSFKDISLVLIGPEGGFTKMEVELASENDFVGLDLGAYRLRSETAGIVACQLFA